MEVVLDALDVERPSARDPERDAALLIHAAAARPGVAEMDRELGRGVVEDPRERASDVLFEERGEIGRKGEVLGVDGEPHDWMMATPEAPLPKITAA